MFAMFNVFKNFTKPKISKILAQKRIELRKGQLLEILNKLKELINTDNEFIKSQALTHLNLLRLEYMNLIDLHELSEGNYGVFNERLIGTKTKVLDVDFEPEYDQIVDEIVRKNMYELHDELFHINVGTPEESQKRIVDTALRYMDESRLKPVIIEYIEKMLKNYGTKKQKIFMHTQIYILVLLNNYSSGMVHMTEQSNSGDIELALTDYKNIRYLGLNQNVRLPQNFINFIESHDFGFDVVFGNFKG